MEIQKFLNNKIFIAFLAFILGGGVVWALTKYQERHSHTITTVDNFFEDLYNDDFFGRSRDPFVEMRRMQKQMLRQFGRDDGFQSSFDNWYSGRFGGGSTGELQQREDDKFIYYDIDLEGQNPKELQVEVKDGQVAIHGTIEKKSEHDNVGTYFTSSFQRSFPVPFGVDAQKFVMEQEEQKTILKFPKI